MAMETLLAAIAIIKQSRAYQDERCQALVTSLKDCLVSINGHNSLRFAEGTITIPPIVTVQRVIYLPKKITPFFPGVIAVPGMKRGTEVVTESEDDNEIVTEKILVIGKVQEHPEDAETGLGVGTGNGTETGTDITETDTANPWYLVLPRPAERFKGKTE